MFSRYIKNILKNRESWTNEIFLIEQELRNLGKNFYSHNTIIPKMVNQGKRIRSVLYFESAIDNFQNLNYKKKYKTMAIIEAMHFASIIHDDIIDNNLLRRGTNSFLKDFGIKNSLLLGDHILIKCIFEFIKLHDDDQYVVRCFLRECSATSFGSLIEQNLKLENANFLNYIRMISLKTSPFFKLSCLLGSYLSSENFEISRKKAIEGICIGLIFQAQNDLDCYKFENYENCEDFVQKNITLPIVILKNYFNLDSEIFKKSNQQNYMKIKNLINTELFKIKTLNLFEKYLNRIPIKYRL